MKTTWHIKSTNNKCSLLNILEVEQMRLNMEVVFVRFVFHREQEKLSVVTALPLVMLLEKRMILLL